MNFKGGYEEIEMGFVDGLFELYKLRELILKSKQGSFLLKYYVHINND